MILFSNIASWIQFRDTLGQKTLGFVPTMGHLHEGHLSLLRRSMEENDETLLSIFVNPIQFNDEEDFKQYPRTLSQDKELAESLKVSYLLLPSVEELYPPEDTFRIQESLLSTDLEGRFRPGHFHGMLTVVMKLLNIVNPHRAYFGEKDYEQLQLVKAMVRAFFMKTEIIGCKTLRHSDGLAMSSRNTRLSPEERIQAAFFPTLLNHPHWSDHQIKEALEAEGFQVDYIETRGNRRLGAVTLGKVRLIDNVCIS